MANVITKCPICGYPVSADVERETVCAFCGEGLVISQGVELPAGLFWASIGFVAGLILGPPLIASTESGQQWLSKKAREAGR